MEKHVNVITDVDGKKLVLINGIRFKGKTREEWKKVKEYLKEYVGNYYEIEECSDIIIFSKYKKEACERC